MTHRGITRRSLIAIALAVAVLLALPSFALAIPRDIVLSRGKVWVDKNVPYSQSRFATVAGVLVPDGPDEATKGFRTDCSGFVSMCLDLRYDDGRPKSLDTASLPAVLEPIEADVLAPGDVVLRPKNLAKGITGHAVIFVAWVDDTHTKFITYEEGSSATGTYSRTADIGAFYSAGYKAYRYEDIEDDFADCQQQVSGADRYATAAAASKAAFPQPVDAVVVASGETWPDALGGAALSGAVGGPVLLTAQDRLPQPTVAEIQRLRPSRVFLLGGLASVDADVEAKLRALGTTVTRLGGKDRYETAALIARQTIAEAKATGRTVDQMYVATGETFPDALAAAPVSAHLVRPVVLTESDRLTPATQRVLGAVPLKLVWILGGETSVEPTVAAKLDETWPVYRLAGADRYSTAATIARHGTKLGMTWADCGLASGATFADALSGGAAQGAQGKVLLLTYPTVLSNGTRDEIERSGASIGSMRVFGGINSVTYPVRQDVADMLRAAQ